MKTVTRNDKGEITHLLVGNTMMPKKEAEKVLSEPPHYFPNDFESWQETHFEIVSAITLALEKDEDEQPIKLQKISETQGIGGLYELAKELTNEFEKLHEGRVWDGEFIDEMEKFINEKIY
jgi:hypothetical protein